MPQGQTALKTRATPKQARAQQRVSDIMNAAVDILRSQPPADLTAIEVAAQAQIPVSSVYRYFPTIEDLVEELYLQAAEQLKDGIAAAMNRAGTWRDHLHGALSVLRDFLHDHPYYRPLLVLIAARRGPQTLTHDFNAEIVALLSQRWAAGQDGFRGGDPALVAATTVQIALSLEELAMQHPPGPAQSAQIAELTRVLDGYLDRYLHD